MENRKTPAILQAGLVLTGLALALVVLPAGCVSRSVPPERYQQSEPLAAPSLSVTLPDPDKFSFAFVGDLHINGQNTERLRRILAAAAAEGDAFVVLLGDIADGGARDDFQAVLTALSDTGFANKALFVIGNHDIFEDGWTHFRDLLGPSHYSTTIGNTRFLAVDSADGTLGEKDGDWLRAELGKPGPTNTFVLSHYAPIVPGVRTYLKIANEEEAAKLMKLSTLKGVTGWLSGHHHSYISEKIDGVTYTIAGGAGGRRMQPVEAFFYGQATVDGKDISYRYQMVE